MKDVIEVMLKEEDFAFTIARAVIGQFGFIEKDSKYRGLIKLADKYFRCVVTPSYDTGMLAHFDGDYFVRSSFGGDFRLIFKTTFLSDRRDSLPKEYRCEHSMREGREK